MEIANIRLKNNHSVGLGDNLCLLSALAQVPPKVNLHVNNEHGTFDRLSLYKKIFKIPDSHLEIVLSDTEGTFDNVGWPMKLFCDYHRPPYVLLNGATYKVKTPVEKKCIGIVGSYDADPTGKNEWPYSRCRPMSYWLDIIGWLKGIGYEVITLDNPFFDLETKIELMVKYCKAVISYEGGMAHLAHMLDLPCFLVDWKLPSPSTTLGEYHCEFVHRSRSTYFVKNHDNLPSWTEGQFSGIINQLNNGQGNNRLLNGDARMIFKGPGITGEVSVVDKNFRTVMVAPEIFSWGGSEHGAFLNQFYAKNFDYKN